MVLAPPSLPMRFPCWVKATYSWGGETKKDLGFIEGDLIECLNAGDGSWWMGRLRRDRRMVGLFPSNFVAVLGEDFQPSPARSVSPLPPSPSPNTNPHTPSKSKSMFRKPFQAYYDAPAPNPEAAERERLRRGGSALSTPNGSFNSHKPYASMKRSSNESDRKLAVSPIPASRQDSTRSNHSQLSAASPRYSRKAARAVSPAPPSQLRAVSPAPPLQQYSHSRAASPAPPSQYYSHSRAASPAPSAHHYSQSRAVSPAPYGQYAPYRAPSPLPNNTRDDSPPPPAPPPHRYATSRAPSPQPPTAHHTGGYHTPERRSADGRTYTPSPLTNAMNDVMQCLEDIDVSRREDTVEPEESQESKTVWSPDAFNEIYANAKRSRPHTTLGHQDSGYGTSFDDAGDYDAAGLGPPAQLDDYVQRMEDRLRLLHEQDGTKPGDFMDNDVERPPAVPPKNGLNARAQSSLEGPSDEWGQKFSKKLSKRRSAYELSKGVLSRTFTTKTNSSSSTSATHHTLMSGTSAGGFSATSAGSFYRRKGGATGHQRPMSVVDVRGGISSGISFSSRPQTPVTGISYHSSHGTIPGELGTSSAPDWLDNVTDTPSVTGGLTTPKQQKKSGFFKKMIDSAKTGAANARSTISSAGTNSRPGSPIKSYGFGGGLPNGVTSIAGGPAATGSRSQSSLARDMGLGGASEWMQVRRDINRSNSLSKNEKSERAERCQMQDIVVMTPVEEFFAMVEGDEGLDGLPIGESTDFSACNLSLVDKSARFVNNLPPVINATSLVQGYLCRPYRSDVQRLRAIFTWVAERVSWEEDFELNGVPDTRRVIQMRHGCSQEIATLVAEMCTAIGVHSEVVHGYLKTPGEALDLEASARPNHWWNAVIVDGEWRIIDCSLASSTNPKRAVFSTITTPGAEGFWFLTRPAEACYTHVPLLPEQQHIVPSIPHEILLGLPTACPPYFKHQLQISDFDTSLLHLENLEFAHLHFFVPDDVECVAEVEVRTFAQDNDGDYFESGELVRKPALSQAEWVGGRKRYTIKSLLPGDEGTGVLKIHAGKKGLMHSIKSNPHPLAVSLPISHVGQNPHYDFFTRHPTPHAQRHDLYVVQPQCARLSTNNTFVFSVRQHPSSLLGSPKVASSSTFGDGGRRSPNPFARPSSAMSMASFSATGSNYSSGSGSNPSTTSSGSGSSSGSQKPAKLAIQSPSGKIIRLTRKVDGGSSGRPGDKHDGSDWETVIKVGERGTWRGLVLADRSARWCVFGEWECV